MFEERRDTLVAELARRRPEVIALRLQPIGRPGEMVVPPVDARLNNWCARTPWELSSLLITTSENSMWACRVHYAPAPADLPGRMNRLEATVFGGERR